MSNESTTKHTVEIPGWTPPASAPRNRVDEGSTGWQRDSDSDLSEPVSTLLSADSIEYVQAIES